VPKTDTVRQVDLPRISGGGSIILTGSGSGGGGSNAHTVDGYHASSTPTPGYLLALNASAQFAASVIKWADVAGVGLAAAGNTLAVKWGASPTTIVPDAATDGGSAATAARSDHTHAILAAAATTLTVSTTNAEGNATSFARSNHTHAITSSSNPGANARILASTAAGYLQLVRLGAGVAPAYALQAQGTTPQLRIQSDASNYATFGADGSGNLTVTPSGNSALLPGGKTLSSANWASQTTGWGIYPESTYGRDGYADFRYIYADELHVKAFIADLEQALAGGQIISKSVAILAADFTVPAKGSTATLIVEDLPGTTAAVFASGDWIRIRNISRSGGGLSVADCYGTVGAATPNGDGTQSYTLSRPAGDTGSAATGAVVKKGGLALDYGVSGNGYWEVTTLDPAGSPYAQVATWATHPQNQTVRVRLGNLDGIAGIGAEWGLWAGTDVNHQFKASSAGVELRGIPQYWLDASNNTRGAVDPTASGTDYLFWLGPSSGDKRFGVNAAGTVYIGDVPTSNVAGWAYSGDLTKIDGGDIYAGTVTAEQVSVTMANLVDNPGFEAGLAGWHLYTGASLISSGGRSGPYRLVGDGNRADGYAYAEQRINNIRAAEMYYVECWCWCANATRSTGVQIVWVDADGTPISSSYCRGDTGGTWIRHSVLAQAPSNTSYAVVTCRQWGAANAASPRWDDLSMRPASGANLVVGTPGAARVEVNNKGIEGYSDANTRQFYLDAGTGRGTFGEGKGVLDRTGLMLSGSETSYATYNSVRWLDGTLPAGDEVARVSAGLFVRDNGDTADAPAVRIVSDPAGDYGYSELELSNQPLTDTVRQRLLMYTSTVTTDVEGNTGAGVRLEAINSGGAGGNAALELTAGPGDFALPTRARVWIGGTARFSVTASGATVAGTLTASAGAAVTGAITASTRVGIGLTSPSYLLHIKGSDTVGVQIDHTATTSKRPLVVNRRNSSDNGALEWYQEFSTGDSPTWNFVRVNRPDGSGASFLTAVQIGWSGNIWIADNCSALSFTDRTPYPAKRTALAAVRSMRQRAGGRSELDHEHLHSYVKSGKGERNLSAAVSAQNVVIQDLLERIEQLEQGRES